MTVCYQINTLYGTGEGILLFRWKPSHLGLNYPNFFMTRDEVSVRNDKWVKVNACIKWLSGSEDWGNKQNQKWKCITFAEKINIAVLRRGSEKGFSDFVFMSCHVINDLSLKDLLKRSFVFKLWLNYVFTNAVCMCVWGK